jgi:uncharacterized protein YjiS (DUF1127 family)
MGIAMRNWIDTLPGSGRGDPAHAEPSFAGIFSGSLVAVAVKLLEWQSRAWERRHLAGMSDHMLKDIGLSRADIEREVSKPFWCP